MKIDFTIILLFASSFLFAQEVNVQPDTLEVTLDIAQIQKALLAAPIFEVNQKRRTEKQISIPTLDGKMADFYVYETICMEEPLYSQFPEIRSYILINKDDPNYRGRLSTSVDDVHIMTKRNGKSEFIEPKTNKKQYKLYDGRFDRSNVTCGTENIEQQVNDSQNRSAQTTLTNGTTLKTYRIAIATSGEFYQAQGNTDATVLAKINNYLNLLNDIYEDELAVHFNLIGNNTAILFDNPSTDPIDPSNPLTSTQNAINNTIMPANYDIGHGFHTLAGTCCSGSGVAFLGVICENNFKGGGWTSATATSSDALWMGLFAHEIGHQFGANHTFYGTDNNCNGGQRSAGNGYEPGSGNSLMSYEGICATHNITPEVSTFYFHNRSLEQTVNEINSKTCQTNTNTLNAIPVTTAPANKTIPRNTPFELEGSATDADGDLIYYNWEQFDTDNMTLNFPAGDPNTANTSTTAPLFRSFDPSTEGNLRVFPQISDIVNNTQTMGEILPSVSRNMKFRLTSRDFNTAGGAISCGEVDLTVDATIGPFNVTSQSTATTWSANGSNTATITWAVAGTNSICSNVDILFSTDRGLTFPNVLASSIANDGSHVITIPSLVTSIGRIKVKCSDNYFFDINLGDIKITSSCLANGATFSPDTPVTAPAGDPALDLGLSSNFSNQVTFPLGGNISGNEVSSSSNASFECGTSNCGIFGGNTFHYDNFDIYASVAGTYTFSISANFSAALQLFEGPFSANAGCTNLLGISRCHNPPNTITNTVSNVTVNLTPGVMYSLAVSNFFFGTQTGAYTVSLVSSPAGGTLYDGPNIPAGTGFNYTFMVVNSANNNIVGFEANSDLTNYAAGSYKVYGLSYENTANLNTYVGGSLTSFQSDLDLLVICGNLSSNCIEVTITASSNCPPNYTGANALSGTETGTQDYETDGEIESTQIINASATVDYDSGTSITLDAPFEVQLGATFHAFIDGCGGAMLNSNSSEDK